MQVAVLKEVVPSLGANKFSREQWIDLIKQGIRKKILNGSKMYQIAEETGLCQATISNLYYGLTRFPRHPTIVTIMEYLGYELWASIPRR